MRFSKPKLPREAALQLRRCPVASVSAYALTLSPMYVYMKRNRKFIAVKGPLDFFTEEDLEKLRPFENFYVSSFVDTVIPFRDAAQSVKALLKWVPRLPKESDLGYPTVPLPVAPYELSDAILQVLGPLWGKKLGIEPYFAAVFANELCDLLPDSELVEARNQNYESFEAAILRSGWAVFMALHMGMCNQEFLNHLRLRVFRETVSGHSLDQLRGEVDEVISLTRGLISQDPARPVSYQELKTLPGRTAQKLKRRLERVWKDKLVDKNASVPTILGPEGFIDDV